MTNQMVASLLKRPAVLAVLCSVVMLLAFSEKAEAARFFFYRNIDLAKAELYEMGLSGEGVSVALSPFETSATWEGGAVVTPEIQLDQVYNTGKIQRRDVLLWYYTYNRKKEQQPSFNVHYRILSRGGTENAFSHESDNSSLIRANITGKPVQCEKQNKNRFRCFGRIDMDLDITRAKKSGNYYGTIEITIISY
ncbi:hypothetical protein CHL67_05205 [Prosthecochloris sp. GSB1]|uniref:hypothetical protein n=1 Tax=Prosthecochloris sp. GSB1 TaxID=281093 RepID=UPI000B8CF415|nr:hypothetical protein [Prosthecochloris sp. GSB1]ASQ90400.1 hypothetical protein CHL67_05205 [Prosthecochloris sp. GSB1]